MSYDLIWWEKRRRSWTTYLLIALNSIVYLITSSNSFFYSTSKDWIDVLAYVPVLLQYPEQWYRIVSSMFTHGDIFHIFFNMWFLYMFGKELENVLGSARFALLYLISGLSAIIFHTGFIPLWGPLNLIIPAVGASGSISGILGAYLMLFPRRRLSLCYFLFIIPLCFTTVASAFLVFWFALQVIYGYLRFGSVAFFAHVGGFVAGIATIFMLFRKKPKNFVEDYSLFRVYITWSQQIGLGKTIKTILAILLAAVMFGGIYSGLIAPNLRGAYVVDIRVWNIDQESYSEDQAAYAPLTGDRIAPSKDDPRVIFNRLYWAGLLNGPPSTQRMLSDTILVRSEQGVPITVKINGIAMYDINGVLTHFSGRITTDVLKISPMWSIVVGVDRNVAYDVNISSKDLAGETGRSIVAPFSYSSSIITMIALYIAVNKDREIVVEESLYTIPPIVPGPI